MLLRWQIHLFASRGQRTFGRMNAEATMRSGKHEVSDVGASCGARPIYLELDQQRLRVRVVGLNENGESQDHAV